MHYNCVNEDKLKAALMLYHEKWIDSMPDKDELNDITFSDEFHNKMKNLMDCNKTKQSVIFTVAFRKVVALVLAAVLSVGSAVFGVTALRETFLGFFTSRSDKETVIVLNSSSDSSESVFKETVFPYIPQGYARTYYEKRTEFVRSEYKDNKGGYVYIFQSRVYQGTIYFDTEGATDFEKNIIGENSLYYEKNGTHIFWQEEDYYYMIDSNLPKDEIFKIAVSSQK